jgi:hypothetical protein
MLRESHEFNALASKRRRVGDPLIVIVDANKEDRGHVRVRHESEERSPNPLFIVGFSTRQFVREGHTRRHFLDDATNDRVGGRTNWDNQYVIADPDESIASTKSGELTGHIDLAIRRSKRSLEP